jgi:hypothetical protein
VSNNEPAMSLRDYFAAKAMQAMIGNFRIVNHRNPLIDGDVTTTEPHREMMLDYNIKTGECEGAAEIAGDAYAIADAMLRVRAKEAK